jgi:hypothetical protein
MASEYETLLAIESSGNLNPYQRTQLENYKKSSPSVPSFSFDYKKAAEEAYGELGTYYLRILSETKGDMNKALARLTEDYDRGLRIRTEDKNMAIENTTDNVRDNALARGIYQNSVYDPDSGKGLADQNLKENVDPINRTFDRWKEEADIEVGRKRTDLPEEQKRREFDLEQERRMKAADLAETRGARAYQDYQAKQLANPSLV